MQKSLPGVSLLWQVFQCLLCCEDPAFLSRGTSPLCRVLLSPCQVRSQDTWRLPTCAGDTN